MELELTREISMVDVEKRKAEEHNANINARYEALKNAESRQINNNMPTQEVERAQSVVRAAVASLNSCAAPVYGMTPTLEQTPHVTEFVPTREASAVFTTEKFEMATPVAPKNQEVAPMQPTLIADVTKNEAVAVNEGYSFSLFAKLTMAVFALVVIAMLTLIGINSNIIQQKTLELENLKLRKIELSEENEEIDQRIANAKSPETILQYAQSNGMVKIG